MFQPQARRKYLARNFGVLEIILSIAIFAAFSVYVLQLFVSASNYEKKMKQLDSATYYAVSIIEQFKSGNSPFEISGRYGGSPENGTYRGAAPLPGNLSAEVTIRSGSRNAAGCIYKITVTVKNSGASIYRLNGAKFFQDGRA